MWEAISVVVSGIGLVQNASSDKMQKQMAETLEHIRDLLKRQVKDGDLSPSQVPLLMWYNWHNPIQSHTIILVTGCHEFSEIFDRPTAYALKFAIDQFGDSVRRKPLHAMVIGDIWFSR